MWKKIILSIACPALVLSCIYLTIAEGLPRHSVPGYWVGSQEQKAAIKDWLATSDKSKLPSDPGSKAALEAAKEWVALLDRGQFQPAWERSSTHFRSKNSAEAAVAQLRKIRTPVGKVLMERTLRSEEYEHNRPQAPEGDYEVIKFNTVFNRKVFGLETVIMMKDTDDKWRMAGYVIAY